ncbi:P-loop containing nucleoside triphosphate hydrolase protein [Plectosphaerella plurivora]|uniref:P-loop containing nucleoside triphosphate hydrolase protein n=1 Tax=Plectosphaerella plurivora TaxID=936078 RepID=A0A9P8VFS3_9PEZI|nr:P-loop containing nucleoside triphosphate hydrolase protein [Plectosphaerella plurivora]
MAPAEFEYIPLGCLAIQTHYQPEVTAEPDSTNTLKDSGCIEDDQCQPDWRAFRPDTTVSKHNSQARLFKASAVPSLQQLLDAGWIRLEYTVVSGHTTQSHTTHTILRVYMLPDDIARGVIDRKGKALRRIRKQLMHSLDYSSDTWAGRPISTKSFPEPFEPIEEKDETPSLLELFNTIDAPDPNPADDADDTLRFIMQNILEGELEGVTSVLYPYQRRSIAAMAEREVQPGRFLDPRLLRVRDQHGNPWFFDTKAAVVLREPRYYDGVRGGILAEQMGAGKTLMCLSLILATRPLPTPPPPFRELMRNKGSKTRSLADMAASCATAHGVACAWYFGALGPRSIPPGCLEAIKRNPGRYTVPSAPRPDARPSRRKSMPAVTQDAPPKAVLLSQASFVAVPQNLLQQWQDEISKHTIDLKVLILDKNQGVPAPSILAGHDIIFCTHNLLEWMVREDPAGPLENNNLSGIHFKRIIVDEGHRLGNSRINTKSDFHRGLDSIYATSRWIVTGTPSKGLYGVENGLASGNSSDASSDFKAKVTTLRDQEAKDIQKIGAIATLYLKARPWANSAAEGEEPADWATYVLQNNGHAALRGALNSLIIRHPLAQLKKLYPPIDERVTVLEGSYQDKLALNVFSAIIIFNAVESQRTDMDYFFHPKQRRALMEAVQNLQQASFFGGVFFSPDNLAEAVKTAKKFIEEKKVRISPEDETLILSAIDLAEVALANLVRTLSSVHHEIPILVQDFPSDAAGAWCFDIGPYHLGCTFSPYISAAQKLIRSSLHDETHFNSLMNGGLVAKGMEIKQASVDDKQASDEQKTTTMAGNTSVGEDRHPEARKKAKDIDVEGDMAGDMAVNEARLPDTFKKAQLVATASAKVSYLLDCISEYQGDEKIIIFYNNDNIAWYLSGMMDIMHVQHLIYDKSLPAKRKALYVNTFNSNDKFRVMLMDIGQAAFGLDMRAASRIYFTAPVLNPQVQAQAIGRARRISQQKPVTVETLVLRGSMEEVIMQRKSKMSQAEHWKVKTILDDIPIYDWISDARIRFETDATTTPLEQFAFLKRPQPIFATGFGHQLQLHPDAGVAEREHPREAREEASVKDETPPLITPPDAGPGVESRNGRPLKRKQREPDTEARDTEGAEQAPRRVRFG